MEITTETAELRIPAGCHPKIAESAQAFVKEHFANRSTATVTSIRALVRNHLEYTLIEAAPEILGEKAWQLPIVLGSDGLAGRAIESSQIDERLKNLARNFGDCILPEVDTMRDAIFKLWWPRPVRVAIPHESGLPGARRVKRSVADHSAYRDWPYCELCYRPSAAAAQIEIAGTTRLVDPDDKASARYCQSHDPKSGS